MAWFVSDSLQLAFSDWNNANCSPLMTGSPGLEESRDMSLSRSETRTGRAQDREIDKDWRVLCQALASLFEGEDGVD